MSEINVPIPINDPIRSYSKGTSDRKQLKAQITELKNYSKKKCEAMIKDAQNK